jgi:leucyl aminopeptidase
VLLYDVPGVTAERVLLVGLGPRTGFREKQFRAALRGAAKALFAGAANEAAVALAEVEVPGRTLAWRLQQSALWLGDGGYRFAALRPAEPGNGHAPGIRRLRLLGSDPADPALERALARGRAIAEGMALARDLGNLPGNLCSPAHLADTARALAKDFDLDVEVLERSDMERLGMGAALSVGRASEQPCKFIVLRHGKASTQPIVLVGKGVTIDTGGISLKPGANLDEMKFDMCGAAAVFGAIKTAARLALPIPLIGIVPAVENMPGGNATRPGDVVRSMAGTTIEVLNTDAEGRLILCDALTYAERFRPDCVIALGGVMSGLFANDDALAEELLRSGSDSGDPAWRLPLDDEYLEQLQSPFADLSNLGGKAAGAVTAACFLGRFAQGYRWAHLDIAGTGSRSGPEKGATGRPVPLLCEFLLRRVDASARRAEAAA